MTAWSYEKKVVALVRVDDTPLWVKPEAIEALEPSGNGKTIIHLASGAHVYTDVLIEDLVPILAKAYGDEPILKARP